MKLIIISIIILVSGFFYFAEWLINKKALSKILRREELDDLLIYQTFYADSGLTEAEVLTLWYEIANTFKVPPGKLRPSDIFGKDLGIGWVLDHPHMEDLLLLAIDRESKKGISIDFSEIKSADDYVRAFTQKSA